MIWVNLNSGDGWFSNIRTALRRVRRDAPTFLDVFYCICLVTLLLVADIFYLSKKHSKELKDLSSLHTREMFEMNTKFKEQVKKIFQNAVKFVSHP